MRVYRIETEAGKGICATTGSKLCTIYNLANNDETEHCGFCHLYDEIKANKLCHNKDMVYAFPTMWALKNWFPSERGRKLMQYHGALGVVYDVPELALHTKYQCVFDKSKAHKVGYFAL